MQEKENLHTASLAITSKVLPESHSLQYNVGGGCWKEGAVAYWIVLPDEDFCGLTHIALLNLGTHYHLVLAAW
jgi:hypothetical protein